MYDVLNEVTSEPSNIASEAKVVYRAILDWRVINFSFVVNCIVAPFYNEQMTNEQMTNPCSPFVICPSSFVILYSVPGRGMRFVRPSRMNLKELRSRVRRAVCSAHSRDRTPDQRFHN